MSISRLELAAALIEYDNDPDDPSSPKKRHRDSALFLPFQPRPLDNVPFSSLSPTTSARPRPVSSIPSRRYSTAPSFAPGPIASPGLVYQGENVDIDVSEWGIPQHLVISPISPAANDIDTGLPPIRTVSSTLRPEPIALPLQERALSVHLDVMDGLDMGEKGSILDQPRDASVAHTPSILDRPRHASMGPMTMSQDSILDKPRLVSTGPAQSILDRPRHVSLGPTTMSQDVEEVTDEVENILSRAERIREFAERPHTVLGQTRTAGWTSPTLPRRRRPSSIMALTEDFLPSSNRVTEPIMVPLPASPASSYFSGPLSRITSPIPYPEVEELVAPNPFALPAPPIEQGSRFDPKVLQTQRRGSLSSVAELAPARTSMYDSQDRRSMETSRRIPQLPPGDQTYRRPQSVLDDPRTSRLLDPSTGQAFSDIPDPEVYGKPLRPTKYRPRQPVERYSLLRPKTLIMPVPLANQPTSPPTSRNVPDGYTMGEKPLPAGARSSILIGDGRNSLPLSLSQRTFRSSLLVGGQRDADWIGGTEIEGEEGLTTPLAEEMGEAIEGVGEDMRRKPGRLYGTSLIDQLEARKAAMRGKQRWARGPLIRHGAEPYRVFSGDSRPAMMARKSHLMDPNSLAQMLSGSATSPDLTRPTSFLAPSQSRPGLQSQYGDGGRLSPVDARISKSRSVFGVDQIWEKEMAKLKIIQEAEARQKAEEETRAALEGKGKKDKGKKKKDKGKGRGVEQEYSEVPVDEPEISPLPHVDELPPKIDYSPEKAALSRELGTELAADQVAHELGVSSWFKEDEEGSDEVRNAETEEESDEEDDVPLSKIAPVSVRHEVNDDSDDEVPLSTLAKSTSPITTNTLRTSLGALPGDIGTGSLGLLSNDDEEDDDIPLALRRQQKTAVSQMKNAPSEAEKLAIEDDLPLGYKHAEAATKQSLAAQAQVQAQAQVAGEWWLMQQQQEEAMRRATMFGYGMMPPYPGAWGNPQPSVYPYETMSMSMSNVHLPVMAYPVAGYGGVGPVATPVAASQNIDSWRKDVAVAPVSIGSESEVSGAR
ncbi:hypothetical protein BCR39DRAFT_382521 [Naematelia encephala]|uniref:Uncharacterized protein n=1 Tax=Naematelia encephala TaxID=71784 RepID=A0A1Y2AJ29_9TREE|nr:hypothetical protein BCR39DRAFT_382521 [Naematelia encephala]